MDNIHTVREPRTEEFDMETKHFSEAPSGSSLKVPQKKTPFSLDDIAAFLLAASAFFIPAFFVPLSGSIPEVWKIFLIISTVLVASFLWFFERLRSGKGVVLRSPFFLLVLSIPIVSVLSSAFSGFFQNSFFGSGVDLDSSSFLFLLFVSLFLSSLLFLKGKSRYFVHSLLAGAFLLFSYQALFLFTGGKVNFFRFSTLIDNLFGKWSDLGAFAGLVLVLLLIIQPRSFSFRKLSSLFFLALFLLSFFFACLAMPSFLWLPVGIVALFAASQAFFSDDFPSQQKQWNFRAATFPLGIFIISLLFAVGAAPLHDKIAAIFSLPPVREVSPSLSHTVAVMKGVFSEGVMKTAFGAGPNRFPIEWQRYRPVSSVQTIPLGMPFQYGSSFLFTFLITTGVLGFLLWSAFIFIFVALGGYILLVKREIFEKQGSAVIALASWAGSAFLWILATLGHPNVVLIFLAFLFTGVSLAALADAGAIRARTLVFSDHPQAGFLAVVLLLIFIGSFFALSYGYVNRHRALFAYRDAVIAANSGNFEQAETGLLRAVSLSQYDVFYRALSEVSLARLGQVLSRTDMSPDDMRIAFQSTFERSVSSAKKSTEVDSLNYANWVSYGNVFAAIAPLRIAGLEGAYDIAKNSYEKALSLNPLAPDLYLTLARLDISAGKHDAAKEFIGKALSITKGFADAYALLAGIQESEGKAKDAIQTLEQAIVADPQNIGLLFKLGFLRYRENDYDGAITALEKAVTIHPPYANAKYFLGLSYYQKGRNTEAIRQFEEVLGLNPGNAELERIIRNLKGGREPFD